MAKLIVNNFDVFKIEDNKYKAYLIDFVGGMPQEKSLAKHGKLIGQIALYAHDPTTTRAKLKAELANLLLAEVLGTKEVEEPAKPAQSTGKPDMVSPTPEAPKPRHADVGKLY